MGAYPDERQLQVLGSASLTKLDLQELSLSSNNTRRHITESLTRAGWNIPLFPGQTLSQGLKGNGSFGK